MEVRRYLDYRGFFRFPKDTVRLLLYYGAAHDNFCILDNRSHSIFRRRPLNCFAPSMLLFAFYHSYLCTQMQEGGTNSQIADLVRVHPPRNTCTETVNLARIILKTDNPLTIPAEISLSGMLFQPCLIC